jgi:CBS domain-containing protein
VAEIRAGRRPDDHVDPETLSSLMRVQLRQALRAVALIQKRVAADLDTGRH